MSHERDSLERAFTENTTLISLLSNPLILEHTVSHLPVASVLALSAASKGFHELITQTPRVFRHLDLTEVKSAQFDIDPIDQGGEIWRNVQLDENLTEDDFYSGPLRGIFSNLRRRNLLQHVQTLVLDGLSVTAELLHDIIVDPSFNVRVLSIRDVKNLNERKLQASLQYACRGTRPDPENSPRLRTLYVFGPRDSTLQALEEQRKSATKGHVHHLGDKNARAGNANTVPASTPAGEVADGWYTRKGKMVTRSVAAGWAETLQKCAGTICFDAPLCTGPRHINSPAYGVNPYLNVSEHKTAVATIALGGCSGCGKAPEGVTYYSAPGGRELPAVAPVPAFSSAAKAAQRPRCADRPGQATFVARCAECIRDRYCAACNQWWCESCYLDSKHMNAAEPLIVDADSDFGSVDYLDYLAAMSPYAGVKPKELFTRSCWECGMNCMECVENTQLSCRSCSGGYCLIHNEGSTLAQCDWCTSRGSRVALRPAAVC